MRFIAIIPARYASTRFPGKPLADLGGKSMIQRVYEQAGKAVQRVVVATDDQRIYDAVVSFGGHAVMTSTTHRSGTDRCAEALDLAEKQLDMTFDGVVNIQGDEPFIQPSQIALVCSCFEDPETRIATLIRPVRDASELADPNKPKVVRNKYGDALLFSRSVIPYLRGIDPQDWLVHHVFFIHIGMYAYRKEVLHAITRLEPSSLERAESLEQLRWIENGYAIRTAITETESYGIDTPDDLARALEMLREQG